MTNQEKKAWLNRYGQLNDHIDSLILEKERWMTIATKITPSYSGMPGGGGSGKLESITDKIGAVDAEISDTVDELVRIRAEIVVAVGSVQDNTLRLLLRLRYIDGLKWDAVAKAMHYDVEAKKVFPLHGKALSAMKIGH